MISLTEDQEAQSPHVNIHTQTTVVREEAELIGLHVKMIWAYLREGIEMEQIVTNEGRTISISGHLSPRPHLRVEAPVT